MVYLRGGVVGSKVYEDIFVVVVAQQLKLRLDAIRTHCDGMGCGEELVPCVDAMEHAQKITHSYNSVLECSGRLASHVGISQFWEGREGGVMFCCCCYCYFTPFFFFFFFIHFFKLV